MEKEPDLIITGEEDTEKAKENMQRVMKSIAKPFMDMSNPFDRLFSSTQRMINQLTEPMIQLSKLNPIPQISTGIKRMVDQMANPQLNRLLFPSLAIIERYIQMYREDLNVKKAYYGKLTEDDVALDIWLSENLEEYKYSLEEGKTYRYEARKVIKKAGGITLTPLVPISVINMELVINIKFNSEILLRLMPEGYWESKRGREESYVLVNGKGIENMEDIEDIADLKNEVEYIVLNYLAGLNPYQEENKELLFYATSSLTKQAITGSENRADTITRSVRRNLGVEYPRVKEGIKLLHNLCKDKSFEMQAFIRSYASFLLCRIFNG